MAAKCEKADTPSSKSELKSACSSAPDEAEIPLYPDSFDGFAELPVKAEESQEKLKGDESLEMLLYPDSFHGFAELPVKAEESQEKLKADESLEVPLYPDSFHGFEELPVKCDEYQEKVQADWSENTEELLLNSENFVSKSSCLKRTIGDDDDNSQLGSPKRSRDSSKEMSTTDNASVEGTTLLPDEFDSCEEILNDIEKNVSKIESLKRNICEDDDTELGSPKRTKTEDDTIWAQSPNEPLRLAASIRGLLRMRNNREVLQRMRNNREAHLRRREVMVENAKLKWKAEKSVLKTRKSASIKKRQL